MGGVLSDCGSVSGINHAVQLVGYETDDGKDYWLLRNSWGTHFWGEHGYFRIERGKNLCNVAMYSPCSLPCEARYARGRAAMGAPPIPNPPPWDTNAGDGSDRGPNR